jgi:hypothetical protein
MTAKCDESKRNGSVKSSAGEKKRRSEEDRWKKQQGATELS